MALDSTLSGGISESGKVVAHSSDSRSFSAWLKGEGAAYTEHMFSIYEDVSKWYVLPSWVHGCQFPRTLTWQLGDN